MFPAQVLGRLAIVAVTAVMAATAPVQLDSDAATSSPGAELSGAVEPTMASKPTPTSVESGEAPLPALDSAHESTPTLPPIASSTDPAVSSVPTLTPAPSVAPPETRLLAVPLYRQQHPLSCETAALKMAMGALGTEVSEDELLRHLARDTTPRTVLADGSVQWGDPNIGYVGQWDGVFAGDGYGVYDGPIADLARTYGFDDTVHGDGLDPAELYDALRQGFPSVVWVPYDLTVKGRGAWTTPAGERVDYVVTEHAVVLAGIDETGVKYADPYTATLKHADFEDFASAMGTLGDRAVIVRP